MHAGCLASKPVVRSGEAWTSPHDAACLVEACLASGKMKRIICPGQYGLSCDSAPALPCSQAVNLLEAREQSLATRAQATLHLPPPAEYALLRLRSAYLAPQPAAAAAPLPAMVDVYGSNDKLASGDAAARRGHDMRLRQLTRQLFPDGEPALDSPSFAGVVAALAQFEISRLQASLQGGAQQVQLMEQLIVSLKNRPGEQAKTRSSKQRLQQRMQPELNSLLRWLAGGYIGFETLPAEVRAHSAAAANAEQWTVGAGLLQRC